MDRVFVSREAELERLNTFLRTALNGQTQICFVTGEAGTGKSRLVAEFVRRSQQENDNIIVAIGNCNAQTGISDPYLPFRHILGMLTGDEARLSHTINNDVNAQRLREGFRTSGRILAEIAPELVGTLIPGAGILMSLVRMGAEEKGWLDVLEKRAQDSEKHNSEIKQSQIFRQCTTLLRDFSQEYPLVIVLDDLQWVDAASNALLFHLSRELIGCRILLVGLYRPNDVAAGRNGDRHPLESNLNEIRRYFGDIWIDLDNATQENGQAFVDALLESEHNNLSSAFREALFKRTRGHALFTTELWKAMQERGDLVPDREGRWQESPQLDWEQLPARVEAIIEERIERLDEELKEILNVACVEGQDFTVPVVARIIEGKERDVINLLSQQLEKRHKLVMETGKIKVGKTNLWRYSFSHVMFQAYLYNNLSEAEQQMVHAEVAETLEEIYAGNVETIATQLEYHYSKADDMEKALTYRKLAGEQAFHLGEFNQAREFFNQVLEALQDEDAEDYNINRIDLLFQIGETYFNTGRHDIADRYYRQSVNVARKLNDEDAVSRGLVRLGDSLRKRGFSEEAMRVSEEALEVAQRTKNNQHRCYALRLIGMVYRQIDRTDECLNYYEQALQIASETDDVDMKMQCLNSIGIANGDSLGNYPKAVNYYRQTLELANQSDKIPYKIMYLSNLANAHRQLGNYEKARDNINRQLELRVRIGDVSGTSLAYNYWGILQLHSHQLSSALKHWEKSIEIADRYKRVAMQVSSRNWLVVAKLIGNQLDEVLEIVDETKLLLKRYTEKRQVYSETLLEAVTRLRMGQRNEAKKLFESDKENAIEALHTKRWAYWYHRAFGQAGIALLEPSETRYLEKASEYFQNAVDYCGWAGILNDAIIILGEMRKADQNDILKPIENYLAEKREIAWINRPYSD